MGWTALYSFVVRNLLLFVWNFDAFNLKYWKIISRFWNDGGIIDTASEYFFIITLLIIIPLWIWGWKKANKLSYVKIFFFPIFWYNDYQNRKYSEMPDRIVLKNIGSGKNKKQTAQQAMEEMIAGRMPRPKDKKDLNSNKIRSNFEQKNISFHKKMDSDQ